MFEDGKFVSQSTISHFDSADFGGARSVGSRRGSNGWTVALLSAAGLLVAGQASAQSLQPSWVHRGAKILYEIAANTLTAATNTTLSAVSTTGSACATDPNVVAANGGLASFKDPDGNTVAEQVDCTQPYYKTTVTVIGSLAYVEIYYSFQTVPLGATTPASPAHGHAVYFPTGVNGPAALQFEPD